jgi:allantoinase
MPERFFFVSKLRLCLNLPMFTPLKTHNRFDYQAIHKRKDYSWPNGARLAVYLGFNLEHFAFGEGLGAGIGPTSPQPDVLNYAWREYGNRVGAWRCLDLFDQLQIPLGVILNTALYDHCPELLTAFMQRGDEMIAHGHTNAVRQSVYSEEDERELLRGCKSLIVKHSGQSPRGWLSPWISESHVTPDLLSETGYAYNLNWCHDDQPLPMLTRSGKSLWTVPYPQELNDIPMIMHRQMDACAFADMVIDNFDEMLTQSKAQPLVMGIALHPYIVGQPYRIRHLRRALQHICQAKEDGHMWFCTPGQIVDHVDTLQT